MPSLESPPRHNNFDMLRLAAATSVLFLHLALRPSIGPSFINDLMLERIFHGLHTLFPGVAVFFIISGFLISHSFLEKPDVRRFARSRFFRIWPPLAASTLITAGVMLIFGYVSGGWILNQLSVVFLYRTYSSVAGFAHGGLPNGSLWTIPIEVGFYVMTPLLLWPLRKWSSYRWVSPVLIVAFMGLSFLLVRFHNFGYKGPPNLSHGPLHLFWFFGMGMLARVYWSFVKKAVMGRFFLWFCLHTCVALPLWLLFQSDDFGNIASDDIRTFLLSPSLLGVVLAAAFSGEGLSQKLLKGVDFSYSLYLVHGPYLIALERIGCIGFQGLGLFSVLTTATVYLMWELVEKPSMALKNKIKESRA